MGCIISLLRMWFSSLTFSSSSSSAADSAAGYADDVEIPPHREKYDVFISFRGEDTRRGITSHLHQALEQRKIETYIDDRLQRGEEIGPALLEAIEKSRLSVIIFSKNYPSSTWCLKELVHILKCQERGQMVIPVFYDISPSDIRNQQGSYAVAFAGLEKRFKDSIDKVQEWRNALTTAANLSGFDYSNNSWTEADLIKNVVDDIWNKLIHESSCDLKGLVGIERRIEQIESLLCIHSPDACITVGIWGMGGIGKTTIAETVFHKLSSTFEASCFLRNVRENSEQTDGLHRLEKTLLKEILKKGGLSMGSTFVRESLSRTKVLIVLDDVSDSMQMERLAGNRLQYGTGSRIIITSRDRRTLRPTVEEDKIYEVEGLKPDDALQLFCSRSFKNNSTPRTYYKQLAEKAVDYAGGIPLALVLLGSSFLNCESKEEWEDELNKLKKFPNENIHKVLRLSYDRLGRNEKEIFLDIACFHRGKDVDEVKRILDTRGFFAVGGIRVLVDMSLISINSTKKTMELHDLLISIHPTRKTIEMHDLLQEMGRTIVLEQCIEDPGQRSRLFKDEDVNRVLQNNTGTPIVQAILVDWYKIEEQTLKRADFKVMSNLMMLIVVNSEMFGTYCKLTASLDLPNSLHYLYWYTYPLKSLPSNFCPENLVELHMPRSRVKKLWNEEQRLVNLKVINLAWSRNLTEVPNLSGSREIMHIKLSGCDSLVEIPGCFQRLDKLTHLDLEHCKSLKYLPEMPENIEILKLYASGIQELPESVWSHEKISYLDITNCRYLKKLPSNMCKLKVSGCFYLQGCRSLGQVSELPRDISELSLIGCKRLVSPPTNICKLKYLEELDFSSCSKFANFPEILEPMEQLKSLNLSGTTVKELHSSIEFLPALTSIQLQGCERLSSIPKSICKLKSLQKLDLSRCSKLEYFPEILEPMEHLKSLDLSGTAIQEIHSSIEFLPALINIQLQACRRLSSIPKSICKLKSLKELDLSRCSKLENFPEILEPMEQLESLCLRGTSVQELHSSIEFLPALTSIQLQACKGLSSIPNSICKLKSLNELDLSRCSKLENFPEILEPMEQLKSLCLSGTAVQKLHSSIEFLPALTSIQLQACKRLSSIPKSICKLKSLKDLNLSGCSNLEYFPEILEPMEHLKSLNLSGTAVKELHSSIEFLPALKKIKLQACERLSSMPKSICKLKSLQKLDVSRCSKLEYFPEILEPMEHLKSLDLSGIAIQEIHSSIEFLPALTSIQLQGCKRLSSIPESICRLKSLKKLDLSRCSKLENFPEILEPMEQLVSLILIETAVQEIHSSIEFLPALTSIQLQGCKRLSSIPESICKLKSLKKLDLSRCSIFENFPEILEPMEQLESLILNETAVQEIHSSIEFLPALKNIQLQACKRLSRIPKSICKLKSLKELNLSRCSIFENFPEILEPMEQLESLILNETAVQEIHSSIEFLPSLKKIQLQACKRLSSIPKSICKLKSVKKLDLTGCSALYEFPKIFEPMERLNFLSLEGTAVEELPSSIGNLTGLETLYLDKCKNLNVVPRSIYGLTNLKTLSFRDCWELKELPSSSIGLLSLKVLDLRRTCISEIPDGLLCSTSLRKLNLSGTLIRTIPASIKQAFQLSRLCLQKCERLQSLPELPVLCDLEAQGCTSLKTVSSSRIALIQGWDKCDSFGKLDFSDCQKLDHNARSNIMDEAQLRIMRVLTAPLKNPNERPCVRIVCPGREIPNWFSFSYQSEGSSVHINLPPDWFRTGLSGFALSVVVSCVSNCQLNVRASFNVKFLSENRQLFTSLFYIPIRRLKDYCYDRHHVYVWNKAFISEEVAKKWSPDVFKLASEASVEFFAVGFSGKPISGAKVERCGVCPLYAEDAEKFKIDRVFVSVDAKIQEETRQDENSDANESDDGSESGESSSEFEANESDDESEAGESSSEFEANESDDESEAGESSSEFEVNESDDGSEAGASSSEFESNESDDEAKSGESSYDQL